MAVSPAVRDDLSNVLTTLDALHARMDSLEVGSGSKNPIKGDRRKDAAQEEKMAEAKKDAEEEEKKSDAEEEKEEKEKKADAKKGDDDEGEQEEEKKAPPVVADKRKDEDEEDKKVPPVVTDKRKDRKDATSAPSSAATAKPIVSGRGDDEDEDEGDKRRDAAIADAVSQNRALELRLSEQAEMIAKLNAMIKPRTDEEHEAFAEIQAKADAVYQSFGKRAPRAMEGESTLNYRKRLATGLKPHSPAWKVVKFSELPESAFAIAETQVYADAAQAAIAPTDLADGEFREVTRINPQTGQRTIEFYGPKSFVYGMGARSRRVTKFNTQNGRQ